MEAAQRRLKVMKDYGTFPAHILESHVNKDTTELMNDAEPDNCSTLKENELSKKHRNLSTLKCKRKVRYNKLPMSRSITAEETKARAYHKDIMNIRRVSEEDKKLMADGVANLVSEANESTKLYKDSSLLQDKKVSVDGICFPPDVLVQETEDVNSEEVANGFHCSLGAPSAASTPLAAANSPLFDYDNDGNDASMGILDEIPGNSPCKDTVDAVTNAKDLNVTKSDSNSGAFPGKSFSNSTFGFVTNNKDLPKSDSQFPVDLSYTQPQSPTIPSRTRSLQQDLNLTADCSVSLLPHGMKGDEEQELTSDSQSRNIKSVDTVFLSRESEEQSLHPGEKGHNLKATKQTTLDSKYLKTKLTSSENDSNAAKRKRESSDEREDSTWPRKIKDLREEQVKTVFKVPIVPPPKTPEAVPPEETPSRGTGKKSCSTLFSSSGDMSGLYTSGMDLFGNNMDDQRSPDLQQQNKKEQDGSLEGSDKENVSNKNNKEDNKAQHEEIPKNVDKSPPILKNCAAEPNYKYVEVVRKRDERAKLNGYKCRDCEEYYQGLGLPEDELKKRLKQCSRHRAKFSPPPSTPPGFWNLSFPDTQEYIDKGYLKTEAQAPAKKRLRKTRRNKIVK